MARPTSAVEEIEEDGQLDASKHRPPTANQQTWMIVPLMFSMMLCGWTEGSVGPLLPPLQDYYHRNYESISLVFLATSIGSVLAGSTNIFITDRFGFGKTVLLGALVLTVAWAVSAIRGTFALFLFSFIINGYGGAIQDAQVNNLASRLPNVPSGVFQVQACFSLGATVSPFLSTLVVERLPGRPHLFFLLAMAVSLLNAAILWIGFKGRSEAQILGTSPESEHLIADTRERALEHGVVDERDPLLPRRNKGKGKAQGTTRGSMEKVKRILSSRAVYAILGWDFFYCGAEVAISEFLTSYLITEREGSLSAGYATMGFWAATIISRFFFGPLSRKLGWSNSMFIYSIISIAAQVIGHFTPALVGTSIAYALVGLMYGPLYPNVLMLVAEEMEDELRVGIIGLMSTVSGLGGATIPIICGAVFDKWGIRMLPYLVGGMIVLSLASWALLPTKKGSSDERID